MVSPGPPCAHLLVMCTNRREQNEGQILTACPTFLVPTQGSSKALGPVAVKTWLVGPNLTFPFYTSWHGP